MTMEQGQLSVFHGKKMRQSSQTECFKQLYMPQLSNRGYLGVTARNSDSFVKSLAVKAVKVMNMDPNFYRHEEDIIADEIEPTEIHEEYDQISYF